VKLLVQPGDGITPLIKGINSAKNCIEIAIFRFDRREIEMALGNAVKRGVHVNALIAYTNRGGEKNLRALELRLLAAGVTVARTADDLVRYHGKFMIVDQRELYLLAFNFTYLDIEHSRSFGIITTNNKLVQEAGKLFEADKNREPYTPAVAAFVVSPANARKQLSSFIKGAKNELLIYDPEISDPAMIRLLDERAKAGVDIRIIGRLSRASANLKVRKLPQLRLHTRTMIRDGRDAFVGSQSLRPAELDSRREVGIIFRDSRVVSRLNKTFQSDWESKEQPGEQVVAEETPHLTKVAKKIAKAVAKELPPMTPVLESTVKDLVGARTDVKMNAKEFEATVKDAVKEAVKQAVTDAVEGAAVSKEAPKP